MGNYMMPRVIEVQFDEIELVHPSVWNNYRQLRFFMHLSQYKRRKSVKSPVIELVGGNNSNTNNNHNNNSNNSSQRIIPFHNIFFIQYIHHLRKRTDSLQILLKAQGKKKNEFKTISSLVINLSHVIQAPMEETVVFRARTHTSTSGTTSGTTSGATGASGSGGGGGSNAGTSTAATMTFPQGAQPSSSVTGGGGGGGAPTTTMNNHMDSSEEEDESPLDSTLVLQHHQQTNVNSGEPLTIVTATNTAAAATATTVNTAGQSNHASGNKRDTTMGPTGGGGGGAPMSNSGCSSPIAHPNPALVTTTARSTTQPMITSSDQHILAKLKMTITSSPLTVEYQHFLIQQQMRQEATYKKKKINLLKWGKKAINDDPSKQPKRDDSDNELDDSDDQYGSDDAQSSGSEKGTNTIQPASGFPAETGNRKNALARNLIKGWQFLKHKGAREKNDEDDEDEMDQEETIHKKALSIKMRKAKSRSQSPSLDNRDANRDERDYSTIYDPPIDEQLKNDFNIANECTKNMIKQVVFISNVTRQSSLLAQYLKRPQGQFKSSVLVTSSYEDVVQSLSKIIQNNARVRRDIDYEQDGDDDDLIKIVIIGVDRYVNSVLRACLHLTESCKQLFSSFRFYLIPIPQHHNYKNSIANQVAVESLKYNEMFYSKEWITALSIPSLLSLIQSDEYTDGQSLLEKNIQTYIQSEQQYTNFSIAQVVIDTETKDHTGEGSPSDIRGQTVIPCVSRVELSTGDLARKYAETRQSKLLKRVQNVLSPTFQDVVDITPRERRVSSTPDYEHEHFTQSQMQYDDERREDRYLEDERDMLKMNEKGDKSVDFMELKIDYFVNKSKQTMKHQFQTVAIYKVPVAHGDLVVDPAPNTFTLCTSRKPQTLPLTSKQKTNTMKLEAGISKIVCKVESRKKPHICARIDGVQWHGVKFLSISPQWAGGLRFSIAHFGSQDQDHTTDRSLKDARSISSIDLRVESDEEYGV